MRICLSCRLVVADDESCEQGHNLAPIGSRAHVDIVWAGVPRERPPRNESVPDAVRAGAGVSVLGTVVTILVCVPFSLCSDHPGDTLSSISFWIAVAVMLAIIVPALIYEQFSNHGVGFWDLLGWVVPRRRRLRPRGVPARREPAPAAGPTGAVRGTPTLRAPLSNRLCLAWSVTMEHHGQIFVRASAASDFTIELPDATSVRISAGRIDLDAPRTGSTLDVRDATAWLDTLAPDRPRGKRDPFPGDQALELVVQPDDTVTVLGDLERRPAQSDVASYREAPPTELVPVGRPSLRLTR